MKFYFALLVFSLFHSIPSFAYPQFIGYGYTACITCHFSPTGGGALNDYGRALFAAEIAAKPFWMKKATDEDLANSSGFLGKKQLPFWIRPGVKYRRLVQQINPGSSQKRDGDYRMQLDFNLNFFTDDTYSKGLVTTLAHLARPRAALPNRPISSDYEDFAMREYFWRQGFGEKHWIGLGFMDKPFGIKHADHTAFNRTTLSLAQNDQVHGLQHSYFGKKTELHTMVYAGNLHLPGDQQNEGLSALFEYEPVEKIRYGVSGMYQTDSIENIYGASVHTKVGLHDHNSWLIEVGTKKQTEWSPYLYSQLSYLITRGLFLEPTIQFTQTELTSNGTQRSRSGIGLLYFPFQRLEIRAQVLHTSTSQQSSIGSDAWIAQTQIHLSL